MQPATAGFHHPLVRAARSLHVKKHRQEARCFLIEGPTAVDAALDSSALRILHVFARPGQKRSDETAARAAAAGVAVYEIDDRTMRSIAQTQEPQGVVAVAPFYDRDVATLKDAVGPGPVARLVAVLHDIGDPGNAGTLIRSAEAFGAVAVCCGAAAVDPYNDKVVRASMGAIFHIALFCYEDWAQLSSAARAAELTIVAAEAGAPDVRSVTVPSRTALVVGNERRGLDDVADADIALRIGIPQAIRGESLNAAVAGSIALYEIARAAGCLSAPSLRTNGS